MDNLEAGILVLVVQVSVVGIFVLFTFLLAKQMRDELHVVGQLEHKLTQAMAQLSVRAEAAETLAHHLQEENRMLIRQQVQLAPDIHHRDFLEGQVDKLTMALGTSADMAQARIMALLDTQAAGQIHAQQLDRDPKLRETRARDGFSEAPPPSASMDPIEIPTEQPRRQGEARINPLRDLDRFDRPGSAEYHPEEELAGVGLDAGLQDASAVPVE